MVDLRTFVLDRLNESIELALDAGGQYWYYFNPADCIPARPRWAPKEDYIKEFTKHSIDSPDTLIAYDIISKRIAEHMISWSPELVLIDLQGKKVLAESADEDTLRLLARVYREHDDYDPAWWVDLEGDSVLD